MFIKIIICAVVLLWARSSLAKFRKENFDYLYCDQDEYFDSVSMTCEICPANQTTSFNQNLIGPQFGSVCRCKPGFINVADEGSITCEECPEFHVSSSDGRSCVKCPDQEHFDKENRACIPCMDGSVLTDHSLDGSLLHVMQCVKCHNSTWADATENKCIPCHSSFYIDEVVCHCPTSTHTILDGQCFQLSKLSSIPDRESSYVVHFENTKIVSHFFHEFYRSAAYACTFQLNKTACHMLVNMCVLLHYNFDNELSACGYYKTFLLKLSFDVSSHVPSLYFDAHEADQVLHDKSLSTVYSFKPSNPNHIFNISVAKFSAEGQLVAFSSIYKVLSICPKIKSKLFEAVTFGTTINLKCHVKTLSLWHAFQPYFYELYLEYESNDGTKHWFPIPVLNRNYMENRQQPNKNQNKWYWQLTRRFFLFDNLSGVEYNSKRKSAVDHASVVRYASNLELHIRKREGSVDGLIYPPLFIIEYKEITSEYRLSEEEIHISFSVKYSMDFSVLKRDVSIAVLVLSIFVVFWSLVESYSWGRRNGKLGVDLSGIVRFLLIFAGNLSNVLFVVTFSSCLYWTIIFKWQDVVYLLLPTVEEEHFVKELIISAFSLKVVHFAYVLYEQITIDIFFIDWEKPRAKNTIPHPHLSKSMKDDISSDQPISIWRIYFIANEWTEVQTMRKINLAHHLIALLFIFKITEFDSYSTFSPNSETTDLENIPQSFVCRFAMSMSAYLVLTGAQLLFRIVIFERYIENKLQQFIDLCSMANISVFLLQHSLYGYYIHGRSVYGFADSDLRTFYEQLKREEEDLCAHRGLEASSDCQTFEVMTSYTFREEYQRILTPTSVDSVPTAAASTQHHSGLSSSKSKINFVKVEQTVKAHESMKFFFEMFLQHSSQCVDYVVRDKLFLENLLDVEFQDVKDKCLFFCDQNFLFSRVLFYGQETLLILFEMLIFALVDLLSYDYVLAAVITYATATIIKIIRDSGGKRNIIKKTMVDHRFLI